jgi:hypothetical protein
MPGGLGAKSAKRACTKKYALSYLFKSLVSISTLTARAFMVSPATKAMGLKKLQVATFREAAHELVLNKQHEQYQRPFQRPFTPSSELLGEALLSST